MDHDLYINEDGTIECVYDDELTSVLDAVGHAATQRASHVEPFDGPAGQGWTADMRPVGGPVLFDKERSEGQPLAMPFRTRAEALAAERCWLAERMAEGPLR